MSKEIVKYKQLYKVIFKDSEVKLITPEQYTNIKEKLFKNEWVEIDTELFNPFEIKKIIKYKTEDGIIGVLNKESDPVKAKVKEYMKIYKKDLSVGVVKNMIAKAKEDLHILS